MKVSKESVECKHGVSWKQPCARCRAEVKPMPLSEAAGELAAAWGELIAGIRRAIERE